MATHSNLNTGPAAGPVEAAQEAAAQQIAPKRARRWRARAFQGYLLLATIAFGVLVVLASQFNYFPIDLSITRAVQTVNLAWFASLMWWVSYFGYAPQVYLLVGLIAVVLYAIGLRWEAVVAVVAALGSGALNTVVKIAVHRPRPGVSLVNVLQQINGFSFPSGHVMMYTAFLGFLCFLGYSLLKRSAGRTALLAFLGSAIALIGLSRIYVGDHWASDVAGAYLLGSLWLVATIYIYQWGKTRFFVRQPLAPEKTSPASAKP